MKFLILLAQTHPDFRLAELEAIADLYNIDAKFGQYDPSSPFLHVDLESCQDAHKLISRSILSKSIYQLYGTGSDIQSLHENVKLQATSLSSSPDRHAEPWWSEYKHDSFKFDIISFQGSRSKPDQYQLIESFSYMDFLGPIRMKNPSQEFCVLESYPLVGRDDPPSDPAVMYFGRLINHSDRRVVDKYDLKKRKYIGTTSFDAELSLVTCNIAQVQLGSLVYDPFVGTGSFLVAGAHFGGACIGSDIDVRMVKGKNDNTNVFANFVQYGKTTHFIDAMAVDFTHNCFRESLKFDAIVCDPPYGVREGLRVLGAKESEMQKHLDKLNVVIEGELAHLRRDYVPPKKPYDFNSLLNDLLQFASSNLAPGKRLCFWMPTANDDFVPNDMPDHEDLEFICSCVQEFNKWSRRLIVYARRPYGQKGQPSRLLKKANEEFREKYFRGFKPSKTT